MGDLDRVDGEIAGALDLARAGDQQGFTELYRLLAPRVGGYLRARGVGDVDATVNEVFLGSFRSIAAFRGGAPEYRAWVFSIAWRRAAEWHRRAARHARTEYVTEVLDVIVGPDGSARSLPGAELGAEIDVDALLAMLTPDQRDVILLRVIGQLSLAETAAALDRPVGAIKALQHRALGALRRNLEPAVSNELSRTITESR
jgi:RNA polymerase sigma factor (sigma-70 family)